MAKVAKSLLLLNDTVEVPIPGEEGAFVSVQYGTKGDDGVTASTGTIVLEGSNNDVDWVVIAITPAGGGAAVLLLAAAGLGWAQAPYASVRARMSVVGAAHGVNVGLTSKIST